MSHIIQSWDVKESCLTRDTQEGQSSTQTFGMRHDTHMSHVSHTHESCLTHLCDFSRERNMSQ